jgi:hypothetical protein
MQSKTKIKKHVTAKLLIGGEGFPFADWVLLASADCASPTVAQEEIL